MQKLYRQYLPFIITITIFSEIHFFPLNTAFRISLGIVIINLIGLVRKDISLPLLAVLSGLLIGLERYFAHTWLGGLSASQALYEIQPSLFYYGCFAVLHRLIRIHRYRNRMFQCIAVMAVIDALSNTLEVLLRHDFNFRTLQIVVLAGMIRALFSYVLFIFGEKQRLFIQNEEHQKRYLQLINLAAGVETELFYLRKSADEIETIMRQTYSLYDSLPESLNQKGDALEIARGIHEIKKDYLRVNAGFDDFMKKLEGMEELKLGEIMSIVHASTLRSIQASGKSLRLVFNQSGETIIKKYLNVFTILNNLIDNSISASGDSGTISIQAIYSVGLLRLNVSDEGCGIPQGFQDVVFSPGFTTNYDPVSGKASTGIGLSHVKNLVSQMNGQITIDSEPGKGTSMTITLPVTSQESKEDTNDEEDSRN